MKEEKEKKFLTIIFIISSLSNIILSFFISQWVLGRDSEMHYMDALNILKGKFPIDRTFLYNLLLSLFLYFNKDYWVTQVVNSFISSLFLIPLYYIAKQQFNKEVAVYSVLFMLIVPFRMYYIITTPKLLAVFFILTLYYFFLKKQYDWKITAFSILAFLTHQYALFFIIPVFLLMLKDDWKKTLILSSLLVLVVLSWIFLNQSKTKFIYYPISVNGWEKINETSYAILWNDFYSTPVYKIIGIRVVNFLIPTVPLLYIIFKTINIFSPIVLHLHKVVDLSTYPWVYHYLQSFSGFVGIILYLFAILGMWRLRKMRLVSLMLLSYLFIIIFFGFIISVASDIGLIFAPLFVMFGLSETMKKQNKNKWLLIILISLLIECSLMFFMFNSTLSALDMERQFPYYSLYKLIRS